MIKSPILNAFLATIYIVVVASIMKYGSDLPGPKDTILAPIAFISLFTLSAAVMGYLFVYQPLCFYLDGEKKKAVNFFLKTVGVFAVVTILMFLTLFLAITF